MFQKLPSKKTMGTLLNKIWFCNLIMWYNVMKMTSMIFLFLLILSTLVVLVNQNVMEIWETSAWGFLFFSVLQHISLSIICVIIKDVDIDDSEEELLTKEITMFFTHCYIGKPLQSLINECKSYAMKADSDNIIKLDEYQYLYITVSEEYLIRDITPYIPEKQLVWTDITNISQFKPTKEGKLYEK